MDTLLKDVKYAIKKLVKDKAFSLTTVLTLGLVLGANAAIFTIVNSVLLQPLPVDEPHEILTVYNSYPNAGVPRAGTSIPHYYDRLEKIDAFEQLAIYNTRGRSIHIDGRPEQVAVMQVTPSFFPLLGANAGAGRVFAPEEGEVGQDDKLVLSHGLAQQLFGDADAGVGETINVNGVPHDIVGVMPASFYFIDEDVRMWLPLAFSEEDRGVGGRHSNNFNMIGRLRDGATAEQAQAQIDALNAANIELYSIYTEILKNAGFHTVVTPFQEDLVRDIRGTLYLLWAGVACVLLIGCVNIVNLVLVRSNVRLKELATRAALGAGRARMARQLLTESMILTWVGGTAGLAIGRGGLVAFAGLGLSDLPRSAEIAMSTPVILYTLGLAVVLGAVLALAPLVAILRADLNAVLRDESRGGTVGQGARFLRRGLVTAQVAAAFLLLIGAGLLLASFQNVLAVDPGFNPENVMTATVSLPRAGYESPVARKAFNDRVLADLRAQPGVKFAGTIDNLPFSGSTSDSVILAEGYVASPGESLISPSYNVVSPEYFKTMGIELITGRLFDERDNAPAIQSGEAGGEAGSDPEFALRNVIVDEKLAKKFWGDANPIGKRMFFPNNDEDFTKPNEETEFMSVIGVVATVKQRALVDGDERVGAYYFCNGQRPVGGMTFVAKAESGIDLTATIRGAISRVDPELPVYDLRTMDERLSQSLVNRRAPMVLVIAFGGVALFLAALGIYGVLAYLVAQRTREIGIRMALGGQRREIFGLVMSEGVMILVSGMLAGFLGVVALRGAIANQLYGLAALDPTVILAVGGALVLIAVTACAVPAARATRIHPVVALHE